MKTKSMIVIGLVLALAIAVFLLRRVASAREEPSYRFATVEKGNIQSTVSATGTLQAVKTVSVGTQVSGQVSQLLVDYNDEVRKGQLLARIDPTLALQAVSDAQANLEKAQAQSLQAQREYSRSRSLENSGLVARSEIETTQSAVSVLQSTVKSARIALQRAQQNLSYTNIYAPIDGVVVERKVDQGQTVAASLSAPQLFLIANDLSQMQILAQVGESDIAQIEEEQSVDFSVQALPGRTFNGTVEQVRLQSTTQDNVVNYTVVIAVDNPEGKLLPGMTARVEFLTKSAQNVLKVVNAALRFKPSDEQLAAMKTKDAATSTSTAVGAGGGGQGRGAWQGRAQGQGEARGDGSGAGRPRGPRGGAGGRSFGTLYFLDDQKKLAVTRVRIGMTDGSMTEINGRNLQEGMKVIAGMITPASQAQKTTTSSPFQSNTQGQGGQRRGGPPGAF